MILRLILSFYKRSGRTIPTPDTNFYILTEAKEDLITELSSDNLVLESAP